MPENPTLSASFQGPRVKRYPASSAVVATALMLSLSRRRNS
jgi:hypothetical protein